VLVTDGMLRARSRDVDPAALAAVEGFVRLATDPVALRWQATDTPRRPPRRPAVDRRCRELGDLDGRVVALTTLGAMQPVTINLLLT